MLMDSQTYEAYERFGTNVEPNGKPIKLRPHLPLPELTSDELAMYDALSDPAWSRYRRFEQERVPLPTAKAALDRLLQPTRLRGSSAVT